MCIASQATPHEASDALFPARPGLPPSARQTLLRRRKLWDIAGKYHCPLIGTCLSVEELRRLARRAGLEGWDSESDYALHSTAVGLARDRNELSELMQKHLELKFTLPLRRMGHIKSADDLLCAWRSALTRGEELAGMLWAALSHACVNEQTAHLIYEDIHMLSHQSGATNRADLNELARLKNTESEQMLQLQRQQEKSAAQLAERDAEIRALHERLKRMTEVEHRLHEAETRLRETSAPPRPHTLQRIAELEQRLDAETRRAVQAEKRSAEQERHAAALLEKIAGLQEDQSAAEEMLTQALTPPECRSCEDSRAGNCAGGDFSGRCILCVGGRTGLADQYRALVERSNGRFIHHDGGIEDNPKRLQSLLSTADAVICPADNVSHGAYYVVKRLCKQYGKPCVLLNRSGLSTFARGLAELADGRN